MRLVYEVGKWMDPTDGAIIPHLADKATDAVADTVADSILATMGNVLQQVAQWLLHNGIPLAAEGTMIWGLICFLVACSGSGKWLERGTRAVLMSILLGVSRLVVSVP